MDCLRKSMVVFVVVLSLIVSGSLISAAICRAECPSDYKQYNEPSGIAIVADLVIVRPLTLVASVAGAAVWVVALPFTLLGGNTGEAGDVLVVSPVCYTFLRPLGYVGNEE